MISQKSSGGEKMLVGRGDILKGALALADAGLTIRVGEI
jgi:hypothetical protein